MHDLDSWLHVAKLHLLPAPLCFTVREFCRYPFAAVAYLLLSQVLSAVTLELCAAQAKKQGWQNYNQSACQQCRARARSQQV
jgi:hypothetical protein